MVAEAAASGDGHRSAPAICMMVISAGWHKERAHNSQQLCDASRSAGFRCSVRPAILGTAASEKRHEYAELLPVGHSIWDWPGKAGAFLSKALALQEIRRGGCEMTLVLEDDAAFAPDGLARLRRLAAAPPATFDVIQLHAPSSRYNCTLCPCRMPSPFHRMQHGLFRMAPTCGFSMDMANLWSASGAAHALANLPLRGDSWRLWKAKDHDRMPGVVKALAPRSFDQWMSRMHIFQQIVVLGTDQPWVVCAKPGEWCDCRRGHGGQFRGPCDSVIQSLNGAFQQNNSAALEKGRRDGSSL